MTRLDGSKAVLACVLASLAVAIGVPSPVHSVQESLPREPSPGSKDPMFTRVNDNGAIVVKKDGAEREYALVGVEWPEDEGQRGEARAYLERLLSGEGVRIEAREQKFSTSRPNGESATAPAPAYIRRAPDGLLINSEIIRLGYAKVAAKPAFEQMAAFREAEKRARDAGKGVWADDAAAKPTREVRREREKPAGDGPVAKPKEPASLNLVYITPSGQRYHLQSCHHARNAQAVSLAEAIKQGKTPCSICKPPERP